jgi:hypothetical protein
VNRVKYLTNKNLHHSMSIECMTENIRFNLDSIDASAWIRSEVPSKYKQMCATCARRVFLEYEGKKATETTLKQFIKDLHEEIKKEVQS